MENNRPLGWTTLDEAKRLVEAGIDPNTADMYYHYDTVEIEGAVKYISGPELATSPYSEGVKTAHMLYTSPMLDDLNKVCPCWSLGALKNIVEEEFGKDFSYENGEWIIIVWTNTWGYKHYYFEEIVNCVIWILENGYIKKT